jgi:dipeptidyl aminopeptidase/acylaminoacyl peptidase
MTLAQDIRTTNLYREAEALYQKLRHPGTGRISDTTDINVAADASRAVFAGSMLAKLEGGAASRIVLADLENATTRILTVGPNSDRLPKFSPDARQVAFLSDRHQAGDYQLYLLDPVSGAARATSPVEGWVEYLHWSPDGRKILLGVAGHGADVAGGQGAVTSKQASAAALPSWIPTVEAGAQSFQWRRAWIYDLASNQVHRLPASDNIWEAVWCGNEHIAAVVSPGPGEGLWYSATLNVIAIDSGESRKAYTSKDQLGLPTASPNGKLLAFVEAVCSDRWIVSGDLRLITTPGGTARYIDTLGVSVTHTEWRSDRILLFAGHKGFETVVGYYDVNTDKCTEVWTSTDVTAGGRYASVSGFGERGDCVLLGESFTRAPEVAVIRNGEYRTVWSLDPEYSAIANSAIGGVERVTWKAPDGLEIKGWLVKPKGNGPFPLVMNVHGGPVWHWRPHWMGRPRYGAQLMLLQHGYAVFYPNPRGSGGEEVEFARRVKGDMHGADTQDYLSGLDMLVARGLADPKRLGVMGISYGGAMSAWLISQDTRFAAAIPVSPVTNHVTEHLLSNIGHFVAIFLDDHYRNAGGKYYERSPLMHAHKVKTPTLNICGALDRCTPPAEAIQFHAALLENNVESVLVTYPEEGHGVASWPAAIDYAARVVDWFETHMAP